MSLRYGKMNRNVRRTVTLPPLSGGVNLRDSMNQVSDHQLTDCRNMWFLHGMLRTRPNVRAEVQNALMLGRVGDDTASIHVWNEIVTSAQQVLVSCLKTLVVDFTPQSAEILFWWQGATKTDLPGISVTPGTEFFVTQQNNQLLCFTSERKIFRLKLSVETAWHLLSADEIYAPLIASDCAGIYSTREQVFAHATMEEGKNLIGTRCRFLYSTVDAENQLAEQLMKYMIPCVDFSELPSGFEVKITDGLGTVTTHTLTQKVSQFKWKEVCDTCSDQIQIQVSAMGQDMVLLELFDSQTGELKTVSSNQRIQNNMEITVPCPCVDSDRDKVFQMSHCTWFGGSTAGLSGGTRLFLCGNRLPENRALLVYSDLNQPLYFNENCTCVVGNTTQKITAFGKQDSILLLLKENECFYTKYVDNTSALTTQSVESGTVTDLSATRAFFPIIPLNPAIGCDCPETVCLCRNRLVWAHSSGKVFSLVSASGTNERNVYEISGMIEPLLSLENGLQQATAADFAGHYVLFVKTHAYLMDYNSYGYQYANSFSKEEDANNCIPWQRWDFDFLSGNSPLLGEQGNAVMALAGKRLLLLCFFNAMSATETCIACYTLEKEIGNGNDCFLQEGEQSLQLASCPISCHLQTKMLEFENSGCFKTVDSVDFAFGNNGGNPIQVKFLTECGQAQDEVTLSRGELSSESAGYVSAWTIRPGLHAVRRVAVALKSNGLLAVDSIALNYRLMGGI